MIRMEGLSRAFERNGAGTVYALRDFDLDVQRGETLALLGPSGCGKTTTLKLLNRLLRTGEEMIKEKKRKAGRTKLPKSQVKHVIAIRLTDAEKREYEERAIRDALSLSDWIRKTLQQGQAK